MKPLTGNRHSLLGPFPLLMASRTLHYASFCSYLPKYPEILENKTGSTTLSVGVLCPPSTAGTPCLLKDK